MKYVSVAAFIVIFLSALFLFMRDYPSDRWFSAVFVVAGGVLVWCAWGDVADAGTENTVEVEKTVVTETTSVDTNTN